VGQTDWRLFVQVGIHVKIVVMINARDFGLYVFIIFFAQPTRKPMCRRPL
jgi:hypothetical protein